MLRSRKSLPYVPLWRPGLRLNSIVNRRMHMRFTEAYTGYNINVWQKLLFSACAGLLTYNFIAVNNNMSMAENDKKQKHVAVITGGASGIGKGIALKCGKEEFDTIIIIDINEKQLNLTKQELLSLYPSTNIIVFTQDITNKENIGKIVNELKNVYGINHITHLFNNAGIGGHGNLREDTDKNLNLLHRTMDINFWAHVYCTQLFLPLLNNDKDDDYKSYIVNTASLAAIDRGGSIYHITKHALAAYSETLVIELSTDEQYNNIEILCLCPGFVATDLVKNSANILNMKIEGLDDITKWMADNGMPTEQVADKIFESIDKGEFWIFPHQQEAYYVATIRYQSWITRMYDQSKFDKQFRSNFGKFHWEK